ncbi:MAG TPA: DUF2779 domain-containing protein [Gemmatimonadaceae bacterium]|nr:DUF2779 domain-containing protein [Gemmatimonadaceae bacterium]
MPALSKSRFLAGWQCPKLLWWQVHEPNAKELEPDVVLRDLFDQGQLVGERAREEWPDGVLIEGERYDPERVVQTMRAIDGGAPALFEACFEADDVFCAIDVLERNDDGAWTVIEVKSSNSVKDFHIPDLAVQLHVLRASGLRVTRAEVMHLNGEYRHPGGMPLFVREDVTAEVEALTPLVPHRIAEQLAVLDGQLPVYPVGSHCWFRSDDGCPFHKRCWPDNPDHISNLLGVGPVKTMQWMSSGVHTMSAIPASTKLNPKQQRQMRAQREGRMIIERGLLEALRPAIESERLGFLDFETVGRAIPAWNGLGPWRQAAAQFSYHERTRNGERTHAEFLAEGPDNPTLPPDDPREPIARAMINATKNADRVVVYTSFEGTRIKELAEHLPHLAEHLNALRAKLWDLNPVIANNVYHPGFRGSFSLKYILTPLVPELSYSDLVIVDGKVASVEIARLLFVSGRIPRAERDKTRRDLLDYCERDTFATVRLVERLMEIAAEQ